MSASGGLIIVRGFLVPPLAKAEDEGVGVGWPLGLERSGRNQSVGAGGYGFLYHGLAEQSGKGGLLEGAHGRGRLYSVGQ